MSSSELHINYDKGEKGFNKSRSFSVYSIIMKGRG